MVIPIWLIVILIAFYVFKVVIAYSSQKYLRTIIGRGVSNFESLDFVYNIKGICIKGHLKEDKSLVLTTADENNQTA